MSPSMPSMLRRMDARFAATSRCTRLRNSEGGFSRGNHRLWETRDWVSGGSQGTPGWGETGHFSGQGASALRRASLRRERGEAGSVHSAPDLGESGIAPEDLLSFEGTALPVSLARHSVGFEGVLLPGLADGLGTPRSVISKGSGLVNSVVVSKFLHVPPLAVLGGLLCSGMVPCLLCLSTASFQRLIKTSRTRRSSIGDNMLLSSAFFRRFSSRVAFHLSQRLPKIMPPMVSKVA